MLTLNRGVFKIESKDELSKIIDEYRDKNQI